MTVLRAGCDRIGEYKFTDNGCNEFKDKLDGLDINGHTGEEYRDAKLVFLAWYFMNKDDSKLPHTTIGDVQLFGKILTMGSSKALEWKDRPLLDRDALEILGFMQDDSDFKSEMIRLKPQIESFKDIIYELATIELEKN